jgi:hypothetical protein
VATIQSLIVSCQLGEIEPYTFLFHVPQRIETHPATTSISSSPRNWKDRFADDPCARIPIAIDLEPACPQAALQRASHPDARGGLSQNSTLPG